MIAERLNIRTSLLLHRKEGPLPIGEVVCQYLRLAIDYDNPYSNTKFCVSRMLHTEVERGTAIGTSLMSAHSMKELW